LSGRANVAEPALAALYGEPPRALADVAPGAVQCAPTMLDSERLEGLVAGSVQDFTVLAPAGTIERRYVLAQALRALAPGSSMVAMALKTRGGTRLKAELEGFDCTVAERAKAHHRICHCARPEAPAGLDAAIAAGGPRLEPPLGLWTQPGLFSWDRIDPGSALLMRSGEPLSGEGADVGCGYGALSLSVLESAKVTALALVDIDRRAIDAARRNVTDPRASFHHADARDGLAALGPLDFALVNPPFHAGGREDRTLGQDLVAAAAKALRRGGICRIVANVALPYEAAMATDFASVRLVAREGGFKVIEGRR
jgi:16S rRNA (guanine1207-N2)-methyltransferase